MSFSCTDSNGGNGSSGGASGSSNGGRAGGGSGGSAAGTGGSAGKAGTGGSSAGSGGTGGNSAGSGGTGGSSAGSGGSGGSIQGWPDASNTGIPDGACPNGLSAATPAQIRPDSGAVIECVRFAAGLPYVDQDTTNVTYRYCRFETTSGGAFVNLQNGPVTFEDCEFEGGAGTWIRASYFADNLTVRRCDFSGMANAVEFGTSNVRIEDNYVHDFGNVSEDQHADGFQTEGADGFQILHNTILMNEVWGATSALLVSGDDAAVKDNLVAGAGYTVHVAGDMEVTGNRFSTVFHDKCGFFGPVYPESLDPSGVWSNNLWHDGPKSGQQVPAP
ncbi:MAG TPA: right-handed parallel beta-helix repeat-containing protein [Polyangiaceae bacterium]|nr:right-handed parallel beta-helix repeat-containing protein [Polyangiaceae bacterium]